MCNSNSFTSGFFGKVNSQVDPLGARLATGDKNKLDPLGRRVNGATRQTGAVGGTSSQTMLTAQPAERQRGNTMLGV